MKNHHLANRNDRARTRLVRTTLNPKENSNFDYYELIERRRDCFINGAFGCLFAFFSFFFLLNFSFFAACFPSMAISDEKYDSCYSLCFLLKIVMLYATCATVGQNQTEVTSNANQNVRYCLSCLRLLFHLVLSFCINSIQHTHTATMSALDKPDIQKGRNVSGRSWKTVPQKRASHIIVKPRRTTWEEKQLQKQRLKEIKELQQEMTEKRKQEIMLKKERRLENEKRRAENEFKAMQRSAQVLNVNKIGSTLKAMSKKQLRLIKKTRINNKTGVVEYVSAYAK
jgi:hypothetical protein